MVKYKALQNFESRSQGSVREGDVLDITVKLADEINGFTTQNFNYAVLERIEEPKKPGKK